MQDIRPLPVLLSVAVLICNAVPSRAAENEDAAVVVVDLAGLSDEAPMAREQRPAQVIFTPLEATEEETPRTLFLAAPGHGDIALDRSRAWVVTLESEALWAPSQTLQAGGSQPIRLTAWRTTDVTGRLQPPSSRPFPGDMTLRFQSSEVTESLVRCPVEPDGRWTCRLPATPLDLRVRVTGYVSHYFWRQTPNLGRPLDLGVQRLVPGASLFGQVTTSEGNVSSSCTVRLEPTGVATVEGAERERARQLILRTKPNFRGFFHFQDIPPGRYRVIAEQPAYAPAELSPVAVLRSAETEIRQPLVLRPPSTLRIRLTPNATPLGEPWRVELWRLSRITHKGEILGLWKADPDGTLERPDLPAGEYMVKIQDDRRATLASELLQLEDETETFDLEIPVVWVEGEVGLGHDPLAASVVFGGPYSREKVEMESDEDGEFFGYLPRDGEWLIYVESEDPPISRYFHDVDVRARGGGVAEVELRLPDTRIGGRVTTRDGRPAPSVIVRLYEDDASDETVQITDAEGAFAFVGVKAGSLRVVADTERASSQQVMVFVQEKLEPPPLHLVLEEEHTIAGHVVDPEGRGLAGVAVLAHVASFDGPLVRPGDRVTTDVTGAFELKVPARASRVQITAFPTGYNLIVLPPGEPSLESLRLQAEPHGGTVIFELESAPRWTAHGAALPVLFVDGTPLLFGEVAHWIRLNGGTVGEHDTRLTVPALPAGTYHACLMNVETNAAKRLDLPPDPERCRLLMVAPLSTSEVSLGADTDRRGQ